MTERVWLTGLLVLLGAGWGVTMPLTKIAVSGDYRQFGLVFWQLVISGLLLSAVVALRGRGLPLGRRQVAMYVVIALVGTVLPNAASYQAAVYLPAGVIAILISLVPMFAFPIALLMATDRFSWIRFAGLICGMVGVVLLVGPEASLPERWMVAVIPLALVAPAFYGLEGNVVAKWGTAGLDPLQLLCGASIVGAVIALPLAVAFGQFIDPRPPWGAPDLAVAFSACVHAVVYAGYVWLVGRAGAVFAAQVAYVVTGFGVIWSMVLLDERYAGFVWLAMVVMFVGLFLVQPRPKVVLVAAENSGQDGV